MRDIAPKSEVEDYLNFREGNEENLEETNGCKVSVYEDSTTARELEEFVKLLEFRHFERFIQFSQSDRKDKKKAITSGVNVAVVVRV